MDESSAPITCIVVTPEAPVFERTADAVVLPAFDGEVGILAGHAPMVALVGLGEMRVRTGKEVTRLAVDGGFLQVKDNRVTVMTTRAVTAESIDRDAAEARVQELSGEGPKDLDARAQWERDRDWSRLCERLAPARAARF